MNGFSNITHGRSAKIIEQKRIFSSDPKPEKVKQYEPPVKNQTVAKAIPQDWINATKKMQRCVIKL